MRKIVVALLALLVAFPAAALPRRLTPGSSLCWCLCDSNDASKRDTIIMWVKDKPTCSESESKGCSAQQPSGGSALGVTKFCDGCQIGADGNCIAGSSALKPPADATMLPSSPTTPVTKPLSPVTVTPTTRTP